MVTTCILPHLHSVRMDDSVMESVSSAYLPYECSFPMSLFDFASWLDLTICAVSICVASWGLIASMQSVAFSFISLLVLRAFLGIGEAAFVGVPFFSKSRHVSRPAQNF